MRCLMFIMREIGWWLLEALAIATALVALYGLVQHACMWLSGNACTGGL